MNSCRHFSFRTLCDTQKQNFSQRRVIGSNLSQEIEQDSDSVVTKSSTKLEEEPKILKTKNKSEFLRFCETEGSKFVVDTGNKIVL
jgi:hypothetical protein